MKDFYFVINDNEDSKLFELWVDGRCITDCFSLDHSDEADLMEQLVEFANVPCYKKLSVKEVQKYVE